MRKKVVIGGLIGLTTLFLLYNFLGYKRYLKVFNLPSSGCSPTMNPGDLILVTNLISPKRNDLIVFLRNDSILEVSYFASRIIAQEKDTIRMVDATVYVNRIDIDSELRLKHSYFINKAQLKNYKSINPTKYIESITLGNDKYLCHIEDDMIDKFAEKPTRLNYSNSHSIRSNSNLFKANWNMDNFGPYIVPDKTFFVIGDNRHNSMDSRTYGPISYNNYVGKVINKK